ncbi:hypothetical protein [Vitiosangium sp. GDMCC 1.1324]|uniref:hypothetical protein n=1 Tax=Vitiosangium sp. (strain GDMCC 1.1324) TaxID=2138576 RepID=UPI000D3A0F79|nr:hypothetical protein [Vitiosangium sp. GDMCC 1.1324]PTL76722.1 hypothetical protein DAT35_48200 [Vitiosangium sp. GDMCC 1.1324]
MKSSLLITRGLRFTLLLAASACGGSTSQEPAPEEAQQPVPVESQKPPPEDPNTPHEPLLTLNVTLFPAPGVTLDGPVRLAMGWYANPLGREDIYQMSQPLAIVNDEAVFQGSASADFEFRVYQPPPEAAMYPFGKHDITTKCAMGILLAYQDLNGNGKLDTIPIAGEPIDRIVGTSMQWWVSPEAQKYAAYYMEEALPEWDIRKGFNLLELSESNGPVPLSTPIPLQLFAGGPEFDAFVCEGLWLKENPPPADQCGLTLNR